MSRDAYGPGGKKMSLLVAVSGKGGVGKTTVAALIVRLASEEFRGHT